MILHKKFIYTYTHIYIDIMDIYGKYVYDYKYISRERKS